MSSCALKLDTARSSLFLEGWLKLDCLHHCRHAMGSIIFRARFETGDFRYSANRTCERASEINDTARLASIVELVKRRRRHLLRAASSKSRKQVANFASVGHLRRRRALSMNVRISEEARSLDRGATAGHSPTAAAAAAAATAPSRPMAHFCTVMID